MRWASADLRRLGVPHRVARACLELSLLDPQVGREVGIVLRGTRVPPCVTAWRFRHAWHTVLSQIRVAKPLRKAHTGFEAVPRPWAALGLFRPALAREGVPRRSVAPQGPRAKR